MKGYTTLHSSESYQYIQGLNITVSRRVWIHYLY